MSKLSTFTDNPLKNLPTQFDSCVFDGSIHDIILNKTGSRFLGSTSSISQPQGEQLVDSTKSQGILSVMYDSFKKVQGLLPNLFNREAGTTHHDPKTSDRTQLPIVNVEPTVSTTMLNQPTDNSTSLDK